MNGCFGIWRGEKNAGRSEVRVGHFHPPHEGITKSLAHMPPHEGRIFYFLSFNILPIKNLFVKQRISQSIQILACVVLWSSFHGPPQVHSQTEINSGIQPLLELDGQSIQSFIPTSIKPLILSNDIEDFLRTLEHEPPDWTQLQHPNMTEQSEHLFQFNRERDKARSGTYALMEQPIAFLWAGILRQYLPEYEGFSLALGPELTHSSWGIIRFKPINLPDYLVAIPSRALRKKLLSRQKQGEQLEIIVVCIGTLAPDESLIYAFSHDDHKDGMILPVVSIDNMMYFLKTP